MHYVFDSYTLDTEHYELHRGNTLVRLEPRVFNLLAYLVRHPGHTVTKEDLWAQVWPQLPIFSDQSLKKCVEQARRALGDAGQAPRYIQTVRSRGYRFIAPVEVRPQAESNAQSLTVPDTQIRADEPSRDQGDAVSPPGPVPSVPLPISSPAQDKASAPHPPEQDLPAAEWRQLTVLVCRLVNVVAPAVPMDPEVRLEVIRDYQEICTEVLHRFDGPMPQYRGMELEAHFGYPQAYEDAARRAVLAGLGIVEGMVDLVVYPVSTDNSSVSQSGKIVSFRHQERGRRYGTERTVLPTPTGCFGIDVSPHPCLVACPSRSSPAVAPRAKQTPPQALQRTQTVHRIYP
jgi:DNA-binding winged helix-turn-helix (wHTH) protein